MASELRKLRFKAMFWPAKLWHKVANGKANIAIETGTMRIWIEAENSGKAWVLAFKAKIKLIRR